MVQKKLQLHTAPRGKKSNDDSSQNKLRGAGLDWQIRGGK